MASITADCLLVCQNSIQIRRARSARLDNTSFADRSGRTQCYNGEADVHVKAGDRRAAAYAGAYVEIVGVLIIAYAFLTPLPLWGQLLAAGAVT